MSGVSSSSSGFLAGLGLRGKPELVRIRPAASLGLPGPLSELAVRATEFAQLDIRPSTALVIENEITHLSVDVPSDGTVLWGKGFDVDKVGRLPWLVGVEVVYWGDLDTHGFAILDRLRAWLPQVRSVLMDRETLLAHRDRWVREDRPTKVARRSSAASKGRWMSSAVRLATSSDLSTNASPVTTPGSAGSAAVAATAARSRRRAARCRRGSRPP